MKKLLFFILFVFSAMVFAGPPVLVDSETGEYLGVVSSNISDPNSTSNISSEYGSISSPKSIHNISGKYGSMSSSSSVNNPSASSGSATNSGNSGSGFSAIFD